MEDINDIIDNEIKSILNKETNKTKTILVLSGGSFKGVAQIGAMHCLKKNNMLSGIKTIAATSAGTFAGILHCVGYQPMEVFKFIKLLNFDQCTKLDTNNIITKYGLDDGSRMILVIAKMIGAKGFDADISFKDFYDKTKITFIITGACINDKKVYYFSHKTYPNMKVLDAVRISISIPIVFTPCTHEDKIFVDGGCIDNFPIGLFNDEMDEVIGIYVTEKRHHVQEIKYIDDYLINVLECLYEGITYRDVSNYGKYIIRINCANSATTQIAISCMFDEGYQTALQEINKWKSEK